jgi:hypothetical protein
MSIILAQFSVSTLQPIQGGRSKVLNGFQRKVSCSRAQKNQLVGPEETQYDRAGNLTTDGGS